MMLVIEEAQTALGHRADCSFFGRHAYSPVHVVCHVVDHFPMATRAVAEQHCSPVLKAEYALPVSSWNRLLQDMSTVQLQHWQLELLPSGMLVAGVLFM
jgi:hypothetical protein